MPFIQDSYFHECGLRRVLRLYSTSAGAVRGGGHTDTRLSQRLCVSKTHAEAGNINIVLRENKSTEVLVIKKNDSKCSMIFYYFESIT